MDFRKYIPYRLVILYRWLKRSVDERVIEQGKFTFRVWIRSIYTISNALIPICALAAFGLIIYDFGFFPFYSHNKTVYAYMGYMLTTFKFLLIVRFVTEWLKIKKWKAHLYSFGLVILVFYLNKVCLTISTLDANVIT